MNQIKHCPIETAFEHIGRKWSLSIIRDLFMGKKRFRDFLEANPTLSTRMLSLRLRELEQDGLITKKIVSTTPLKAEYELTAKGHDLQGVLYEMAMYAFRNFSKDIFGKKVNVDCKVMGKLTKKTLNLNNENS